MPNGSSREEIDTKRVEMNAKSFRSYRDVSVAAGISLCGLGAYSFSAKLVAAGAFFAANGLVIGSVGLGGGLLCSIYRYGYKGKSFSEDLSTIGEVFTWRMKASDEAINNRDAESFDFFEKSLIDENVCSEQSVFASDVGFVAGAGAIDQATNVSTPYGISMGPQIGGAISTLGVGSKVGGTMGAVVGGIAGWAVGVFVGGVVGCLAGGLLGSIYSRSQYPEKVRVFLERKSRVLSEFKNNPELQNAILSSLKDSKTLEAGYSNFIKEYILTEEVSIKEYARTLDLISRDTNEYDNQTVKKSERDAKVNGGTLYSTDSTDLDEAIKGCDLVKKDIAKIHKEYKQRRENIINDYVKECYQNQDLSFIKQDLSFIKRVKSSIREEHKLTIGNLSNHSIQKSIDRLAARVSL